MMRGSLFAAALMMALSTASAYAVEFVNVATGGTAGVWYPLGVALAGIYDKGVPGVKASVQVTKGGVENCSLLQQGRTEVGFVQADTLAWAWEGNEDAGFTRRHDKLRAIAALYPNLVQVVATKDAGVRSLQDLKGKRVVVGAPRSGTELNARTFFAAAGLSYKDFARVEFLPFAEAVDLMKNRQADATLQSAGLGVASIRDLTTAVEVVFVPIPKAVVDKANAPGFSPATIPANTYRGQDADVPSALAYNLLVTHSGVSDDMAYAMAKAMFDNLEQLKAAHASARDVELDPRVLATPIPLHPGAERFYREKGLLN